MGRLLRIVMVTIAALLMIGFYLPPMVKLHEVAMIVIILIGLALMVINFVEVIRGKED